MAIDMVSTAVALFRFDLMAQLHPKTNDSRPTDLANENGHDQWPVAIQCHNGRTAIDLPFTFMTYTLLVSNPLVKLARYSCTNDTNNNDDNEEADENHDDDDDCCYKPKPSSVQCNKDAALPTNGKQKDGTATKTQWQLRDWLMAH